MLREIDLAGAVDRVHGDAQRATTTDVLDVAGLLAGFSSKHPKIRVELSIGNRREIMDMLRDYRLDFAIMGRPPPDVAVDMRLIGDHPHILIAPVGHPLARSPAVSLADVASKVLLTREVAQARDC